MHHTIDIGSVKMPITRLKSLGYFTASITKQGNVKEYLKSCQKPVFSSNTLFFCEASPASEPQYRDQCCSCERDLYDRVPMAGISTPLLSLKLGTDIDDGVDQIENSQNVNIGGKQTLTQSWNIQMYGTIHNDNICVVSVSNSHRVMLLS